MWELNPLSLPLLANDQYALVGAGPLVRGRWNKVLSEQPMVTVPSHDGINYFAKTARTTASFASSNFRRATVRSGFLGTGGPLVTVPDFSQLSPCTIA